MIYNNQLVEYLLQQVRVAKNIRRPWEGRWKEIMEYVNPYDESAFGYETLAGNSSRSPQVRGRKYKSALGSLVRNAATILTSQLLDPSVKWFSLDMSKPTLRNINEHQAVKEWKRTLEDYIYWLCGDPESNFYTSSQSFVWDWFTLGTACRYIHTGAHGDLQFDSVSPMKLAFNVDGYGRVNFVVREFNLTDAQAIELWGEEAVENIYADNITLYTHKTKYLHIVTDNPFRKNEYDFRYAGFIVDEGKRGIVSQEWYHEFPYIISRFFQNSGELYGTSSLWNLLPEIKYMDHICDLSRYAAEYAIMPPLKVATGMTLPETGIMPGGRVYGGMDALGRSTIEPLNLGGGVSISENIFTLKRQDINQGLIVQDLFVPDDPARTATQVSEMRAQQDNKIKPIITRWEREDISKTIKFILKHLARDLMPFPYVEVGIDEEELPDPIDTLSVKYTGILGRQQARYDATVITQVLQDAASISQMPEYVTEVINLDEVLRFRAETYDLPNKILKSREETDEIRAQKAQAQAAQMAQMEQERDLERNFSMMKLLKEVQGG